MEITRRGSGIKKLKEKAASLMKETYALYIAARDPRLPWYAKAFLSLVLAYAFSPIDLIPDFIPLLGYLDDLILIPLGITLALKMIPTQVMQDARKQAAEALLHRKPIGWAGALLIIVTWLIVIAVVIWSLIGMVKK